jgi:hypothetical protein
MNDGRNPSPFLSRLAGSYQDDMLVLAIDSADYVKVHEIRSYQGNFASLNGSIGAKDRVSTFQGDGTPSKIKNRIP